MLEIISLLIGSLATLLSALWFIVRQEIRLHRVQDQHTALARSQVSQREERAEIKILLQTQINQLAEKITELETRLKTIENR